ncbi:MAG TPA: glycosyltransferase family 2 protein [Bacteroidia bacterium]|nr:glycosyltransferase family 2 protein [Bacteroidia bacterium]
MTNKIDISIVVPVYNSVETLSELYARVNATCITLQKKYQLIFVDDGSSDNSWEVIEGLKTQNTTDIIGVKLTKNFGQHNALLCGFNYCKGDVIITMDDDLQHPPEEIEKLLTKYQQTNADVVYGLPINKKHSLVRNVGSNLVSSSSEYSKKSTGVKKGSSFRLIKREIAHDMKEHFYSNFLFLDAIINWNTGNIEHIEVEHKERKAGKSGYTTFKLASLYFNILINYSATPLKLMTYGGLFSSIISFLFALHFVYKKIIHHVPLGYTSLIVSVLFSTGLILFCLGIIGQYLYKIYQFQNKKPPYLIKKTVK